MKHLLTWYVITSEDAQLALEHCAALFDTGTVVQSRGAWKDNTGQLYLECGLVVSVVYGGLNPRSYARELAKRLKEQFGQKCVLATVQKLQHADFI